MSDPTSYIPQPIDDVCPVCDGRREVISLSTVYAQVKTPCSFCCGTGHVTVTMRHDWQREQDRLSGEAQESYYLDRREFEEDRATWARDQVR